jgi:hypothetical protein
MDMMAKSAALARLQKICCRRTRSGQQRRGSGSVRPRAFNANPLKRFTSVSNLVVALCKRTAGIAISGSPGPIFAKFLCLIPRRNLNSSSFVHLQGKAQQQASVTGRSFAEGSHE